MVDTIVMATEGIDLAQSNWQKQANCKLAPSYMFFPEENGTNRRTARKERAYKKFCDACPVRQLCLEFAVLHDLEGIWGGTDDSERKERFSTFERDEMREDKGDLGKYRPLYGHS